MEDQKPPAVDSVHKATLLAGRDPAVEKTPPTARSCVVGDWLIVAIPKTAPLVPPPMGASSTPFQAMTLSAGPVGVHCPPSPPTTSRLPRLAKAQGLKPPLIGEREREFAVAM